MPRKYLERQREIEYEKEELRAEKKQSNLLRNALIVLVIAIVAFYFYQQYSADQQAQPLIQPAASKPASAAFFEKNFGDNMLSYKSPEWGFEIAYPIGYAAMENPEIGVAFRTIATASGYSEVMDVLADPTISASDAANQNLESLSSQGALMSKTEKSLDGKTVYVLSGTMPVGGAINIAKVAFYDCRAPDGTPYAAAVTAVVPPVFSQDAGLADYAINTFKC